MPKTLSNVLEAFKAFPRALPVPKGGTLLARRAADELLDLLAPPFCRHCDDPLVREQHASRSLCARCRRAVRWIERPCPHCGVALEGGALEQIRLADGTEALVCDGCRGSSFRFDRVHAALGYEGPARTATVRYKFQRDLEILAELTEWLVEAVRRPSCAEILQQVRRDGALVPVPSHWWTRMRRGWDPMLVLAEELGARLETPVVRALRKTRVTPAQAGLDRAARRANLEDVFAVRPGVPVPRNVLLLDDVVTTGTTASRCAQALRRGGSERVVVLAIARA